MAISVYLRKFTFAIVLGIAFAGIGIQWQPISAKQPIPLPTPLDEAPDVARSDTAELPTPTIDVLPVPTFSAGFSTAPVLSGFVTFYPGDMVTIRDTDSFDFAWAHITDAKWYKFHLEDEQGKKLIEEKFKPETLVCSESNCVLNSRSLNITFTTGKTYTWWVTSKSPIGKSKTNKSHFTFDLSTSPSLVLLAPVDTRTTVSADMPFSWTHVAGSQWYRIDITNAAGKALAKIKFNHPSDICQSEICSIPLSALNLHFKKDKQVFWSVTAKVNNLKITSPSARTIIRANQPVDILLEPAHRTTLDSTVLFTWTEVPGAEWYRLQVIDENKSTVFKEKFSHLDAVCQGGICRADITTQLNSLKSGKSFKWWITYKVNGTKLETDKRRFSISAEFSNKATITLINDKLQGEFSQPWMIGTQWEETYTLQGLGVETRNNDQIIPIARSPLNDVILKTTVQLIFSGVELRVRESEAGAYRIMLDAQGNVSLWRGEENLQTTTLTTLDPVGAYTIKVSVLGSTITAEINQAEVLNYNDTQPLPAGDVSLEGLFPEMNLSRVVRVEDIKLSTTEGVAPSLGAKAEFSTSETIPLPEGELGSSQAGFSTSDSLPLPQINPTAQANFSTSDGLSVQQTSDAVNQYDLLSQHTTQSRRELTGCVFTLYGTEFHNRAQNLIGEPPYPDLIVFDDWEGIEYDEEIRIKKFPSTFSAPQPHDDNPGELMDGRGFKLIERIGSNESHPALSPDGMRVAFVSNCLNENTNVTHIYVLDLTTFDPPKRLTAFGQWNTAPVWSPDGTRIAFHSDRQENGSKIYVMDAFVGESEGIHATRVTANSNWIEFDANWSPDGRYIAYAAYLGASNRKILRANIYGQPSVVNNDTLLVEREGWAFDPAWSPDGRFIAFTGFRDIQNNLHQNIYLQYAPKPGEGFQDLPVLKLRVGEADEEFLSGDSTQAIDEEEGIQINLTYNELDEPGLEYFVADHKSANWAPTMQHLAMTSNVNECEECNPDYAVYKVHVLDLDIPLDNVQSPIPITVTNYVKWPHVPFTAHGFWTRAGGASWSPYVACPDPLDVLNIALTTDTPPNTTFKVQPFYIRKTCLLEFRGVIFAMAFHENSEGRNILLKDVLDLVNTETFDPSFGGVTTLTPDLEFLVSEPSYQLNTYYMYVRAALNGVLNQSTTDDGTLGTNPGTYIANAECTSSSRECVYGTPGPTGNLNTEHNPHWIAWDGEENCKVWVAGTDYETNTVGGVDYSYRRCIDHEFYNNVLDTRGKVYSLSTDDWYTGYKTFMPYIMMAIQDEISGVDPLYRGQQVRNPNIGENTAQLFTTNHIAGESLMSSYHRHLGQLYYRGSDDPLAGPDQISCFIGIQLAPQYMNIEPGIQQLRTTSNPGPHDNAAYGLPGEYFNYPNITKFNLINDSVLSHVLRVERSSSNVITSLTWESVVFQFGLFPTKNAEGLLPTKGPEDGIWGSIYPVNPAQWAGKTRVVGGNPVDQAISDRYFEFFLPSYSSCP